MNQDQALREALRRLPSSDGPPAALDARIRARAHAAVRPKRRRMPPLWLSAAAAVFVGFFAINLLRQSGPAPTLEQQFPSPPARPTAGPVADEAGSVAQPPAATAPPPATEPAADVGQRASQLDALSSGRLEETVSELLEQDSSPTQTRAKERRAEAKAEGEDLAKRQAAQLRATNESTALGAALADDAVGQAAADEPLPATESPAAADADAQPQAFPAESLRRDLGNAERGLEQRQTPPQSVLAAPEPIRAPALPAPPPPPPPGLPPQSPPARAAAAAAPVADQAPSAPSASTAASADREQQPFAAAGEAMKSATDGRATAAGQAVSTTPAARQRKADAAERCEADEAEPCLAQVRQWLAEGRREQAANLLRHTLERFPQPVPVELRELLDQ